MNSKNVDEYGFTTCEFVETDFVTHKQRTHVILYKFSFSKVSPVKKMFSSNSSTRVKIGVKRFTEKMNKRQIKINSRYYSILKPK